MIKHFTLYFVLLSILVITGASNCGGSDPKINYETGTFPEEVVSLESINSAFDDYNCYIPQIGGETPILFASNRESEGQDFDIITGVIWFLFNQTDGEFTLNSEMITNEFYELIESTINNSDDQLGPYSLFNGNNGRMYLFYTDESAEGDLDLRFLSFFPPAPGALPDLEDPDLVSILSSSSNDGYITFDRDISTAYFTSDRAGDYDIFEMDVNPAIDFDSWLTGVEQSAMPNDSLNSDYNDKCPFILLDFMVFTSDRPGGFGGYDLYWSVFYSGKWSSPVNLGPSINTEYNEYRPLIGFVNGFTNWFMVFSSDRPGGFGGYDLYFTGIDFEEAGTK